MQELRTEQEINLILLSMFEEYYDQTQLLKSAIAYKDKRIAKETQKRIDEYEIKIRAIRDCFKSNIIRF